MTNRWLSEDLEWTLLTDERVSYKLSSVSSVSKTGKVLIACHFVSLQFINDYRMTLSSGGRKIQLYGDLRPPFASWRPY